MTIGNATQSSSTAYSPQTGLPTTVSGTAGTITTTYDSWGRVASYGDANSPTATSTYTADGLLATFNDGSGLYTMTYDGTTGEHRRLPTSIDVGVAGTGTFDLAYGPTGSPARVTYPNGIAASYTHNEIGQTTGLDYEGADGQPLLGFSSGINTASQTLWNSSIASAQAFKYDGLGRLIQVEDTRGDACSTRTYDFNASSDRTAMTEYPADTGGSCQHSTAGVQTAGTYDDADRIRNVGYTYDDLGRTTTTPKQDTTPDADGPQTATYFPNDLVATLAQDFRTAQGTTVHNTVDYGLDAAGRIAAITNKSDGAETSRLQYQFAGKSDAPVRIKTSTNGGANWSTTRYIKLAGLGMVAIETGGSVTYQLSNLHGDVVATATQQSNATTIDSYAETDEYGNSLNAQQTRYGWLGTNQRSADTLGGAVLMGARTYNPTTGRFASVDSVAGGSATRYDYCNADPINCSDTQGTYAYSYTYPLGWAPYLDSYELFHWLTRGHFSTFPLGGCGNYLDLFERCTLTGGNPVWVVQKTCWSWVFKSLPGHTEGAGKYISFSFSRSKGIHYMHVKAWGPDNTWCNRSKPCAFANSMFAMSVWAAFAARIGWNMPWS